MVSVVRVSDMEPPPADPPDSLVVELDAMSTDMDAELVDDGVVKDNSGAGMDVKVPDANMKLTDSQVTLSRNFNGRSDSIILSAEIVGFMKAMFGDNWRVRMITEQLELIKLAGIGEVDLVNSLVDMEVEGKNFDFVKKLKGQYGRILGIIANFLGKRVYEDFVAGKSIGKDGMVMKENRGVYFPQPDVNSNVFDKSMEVNFVYMDKGRKGLLGMRVLM